MVPFSDPVLVPDLDPNLGQILLQGDIFSPQSQLLRKVPCLLNSAAISPKVILFLTWAAFLYNHGYNDATSIWINLDETALPVHVTTRHGNVHSKPKRQHGAFASKASLHERRAHCTLVAMTCTCPMLQRKLPQILLPNVLGKKKVWKAMEVEFGGEPPIAVIGDTQGWINSTKMQQIIDMVWKVCQKECPDKRIVMVWDCSPAHIAPLVVQRLRRRLFRPLFIPSKLTHLLQVLDFAVFASFKRKYHEHHVERLMATATGQQPYQEWIRGTIAAIRQTFSICDSMQHFRRAGQCMAAGPYRAAIQSIVGNDFVPADRVITKEEFWQLIGRRQQFVYERLFTNLPPMPPPPEAVLPKPVRRLRSKTTI